MFWFLIIMNVFTFILYAYDKHCARVGKWRVAEVTLLSFAFCGGAFGAFTGMYILRHKTRHKKFQICIPLFLTLQIIILMIK